MSGMPRAVAHALPTVSAWHRVDQGAVNGADRVRQRAVRAVRIITGWEVSMRRRQSIRRRARARIPHVGTANPKMMPAAAINKELDKIGEAMSKVGEAMIAAGRGHEVWSETMKKNPLGDDLTLSFQALSARRFDLRHEVERRAGPGMTRLPKGFGPLKHQ
jgi:hypothetical protein